MVARPRGGAGFILPRAKFILPPGFHISCFSFVGAGPEGAPENSPSRKPWEQMHSGIDDRFSSSVNSGPCGTGRSFFVVCQLRALWDRRSFFVVCQLRALWDRRSFFVVCQFRGAIDHEKRWSVPLRTATAYLSQVDSRVSEPPARRLPAQLPVVVQAALGAFQLRETAAFLLDQVPLDAAHPFGRGEDLQPWRVALPE